MKLHTILILAFAWHGIVQAQGNSGGPNSPIVVGVITDVSKDEKTVTILHQGQHSREITIGKKTKVSFVGMPKKEREFKVGYSAKASLKGGNTKYLKVTQPIPGHESLGEGKTSLSVEEIFSKANDNKDKGISYVEMSRWIYHSPKHGPDHFEGADKSGDGLLDADELGKLLSKVVWWKLSRKTAEEWFAESDANKDGGIDVKEFALINGGDGHIDQRFKRADKDRSKSLSQEEVSAYIAGQIK